MDKHTISYFCKNNYLTGVIYKMQSKEITFYYPATD